MPTTQQIIDQVNDQLGHQAILRASDPRFVVSYLPTGVLPVDYLLDGGLPRGRIVEIFGDYSTLKSLLALITIATTQANGGIAALVDSEHAFDPDWLRKWGGDPDALIIEHPDTAEEAVAVTDMLVRAGVDLIVWDSVAALQPQASAEKKPGEDKQPARLAQAMSQGLRRINTANKITAILMINQTRSNIGMTFGPTETTPGGKALPFYASLRLRMTRAGKITEAVKVYDGEKLVSTKAIIGQKIRVTLEKSKLSRPLREMWFVYDHKKIAVDEVRFMIGQGIEQGFVEAKGAMHRLPYWPKAVRGKDNFHERVEQSQEDQQWLRTALMEGPIEADREREANQGKTASSESRSRGKARRAVKKKAQSPSSVNSGSGEQDSTPARAQAGSKKTAATKTPSTKSRTRRRLRSS